MRHVSVRKLVFPLLLAVFGVAVDDRLTETFASQPEGRQPEIFDLPPATLVVREEIAGNPELLVGDAELNPQKLGEMPNNGWIRVCESHRMPSLIAFGPIEHAPGDVESVRDLGS